MDDPKLANLPEPMQKMVAGRQLWDAILQCCDPDRTQLLKTKLEEYAAGVFMGEKNADVYMALISFVVEYACNLAHDDEVDPIHLAMAMQMGLMNGATHFVQSEAGS